jgi:drug/metabolite transporter (DMT)-like permease
MPRHTGATEDAASGRAARPDDTGRIPSTTPNQRVPLSALGLALGAAFLHAFWNVFLGRSHDVEAATAVVLVFSVILFAPVAALAGRVTWAAAPWIASSSVLELAYFALLAAAYRRSEVSLVYPVARGLAPVMVLVLAVAAGRATSTEQVLGVCAVGLGVFLVRGLVRKADTRGLLFGVAIAVCIAGYTLVDKEGVQHASPLPYLELVLAGPALAYLLAIVALRGRAAVRAEVRPVNALLAAAGFGAYALVLAALQLAPAASVAAVRETSVVIATVMAALVLRERVTRVRVAGSAVVAAGIALLALG